MTAKTRNAASSVQRRNVRGNYNEMTIRRTVEIRDLPNERHDGRTDPRSDCDWGGKAMMMGALQTRHSRWWGILYWESREGRRRG